MALDKTGILRTVILLAGSHPIININYFSFEECRILGYYAM
jgi:hypothetical protein